MARESIAMSTEEVAAFIGPKPWIVLGTLDEDGSPWGDLAASLIDGERIVFAVPAGTRAAANIERDPRVVCMNDQYPIYYEIKGVTAHGQAERLDGPGARRASSSPTPSTAERRTDLVYAIPLDDITSFRLHQDQGEGVGRPTARRTDRRRRGRVQPGAPPVRGSRRSCRSRGRRCVCERPPAWGRRGRR